MQQATEQLALIDSQGCQFLISCFGDSPNKPTFFSCSSALQAMQSGFTVLKAITGVVYDTLYTCHNVTTIGRVDGMSPDICDPSADTLEKRAINFCNENTTEFLVILFAVCFGSLCVVASCRYFCHLCGHLKASEDLTAERVNDYQLMLDQEPKVEVEVKQKGGMMQGREPRPDIDNPRL